MGVSVVQDGPFWNPLTPAIRSSATVAGVLLKLLAWVALVLGVVAGLYWTVATFDDGQELSQHIAGYPSGRLTVVMLVVALVSQTLGRRLVARRRRTVLFLRRFGYDDATRAVLAAAESVGRNWRVVTLDDAEIRPVDAAPRLRRSLTGVTKSAAAVTRARRAAGRGLRRLYTLALIVAVVFFFLKGPTSEEMLAWLESVAPAVALFVQELLVPALVSIAVLGTLWAVAALAMRMVRVGSRSLDTAQEYRYFQVRDELDITAACAKLDTREKAVFNPRLMVIKVRTGVWQQTVTRLAEASDALLFDVSQPTDNLLWELDTLLREYADRCVFIGQLDTLGAYAVRAPIDTVGGRTSSLLDGYTVIGYRADTEGLRRFRRALRAKLEALPT